MVELDEEWHEEQEEVGAKEGSEPEVGYGEFVVDY